MAINKNIERSILQIQEDYRIVYSLKELIGLSISDISELLQITEDNVKEKLYHAGKILKAEIDGPFPTDNIFEFNLVYCDGMVNKVMKNIKEQ